MYHVFFEEEQKFTNRWLWLLLSCLSIMYIYAIFEQLVLHNPVGNNPAPDSILALMGLLPLFFMYLFYKITLKTRIDTEGIYYQFYPFHFKEKRIDWDEIDKFYVRKYKPMMEYGGWGIRTKLLSKNVAYNISGNMGLQIELKSGKKILLGTQNPEDINRAIAQINSKNFTTL